VVLKKQRRRAVNVIGDKLLPCISATEIQVGIRYLIPIKQARAANQVARTSGRPYHFLVNSRVNSSS
jgi:hypothetical protein